MDKDKFKEGFIKRAKQFGISEKQANHVFLKTEGMIKQTPTVEHKNFKPMFKKASNGVTDIIDSFRNGTNDIANHLNPNYDHNLKESTALGGFGGLALGGGLGALTGLADDRKDEHGETHRLSSMINRGLIGGAIGFGAGAGSGYYAAK